MATFGQRMTFGPYFDDGVLVTGGELYHYAAGTTDEIPATWVFTQERIEQVYKMTEQ